MPNRIKLNLFISLILVGPIFNSDGFLSGQERRQKPQTNAPQNPAPQTSDDSTLRISTVLVQTDVTVVDRDGQFIDGLRPDQFELKVDGKPQSISFFQRVTVGAADEASKLAAARGASPTPGERAAKPVERGQSVIFFVDDLHISAEKIGGAREVILDYVNRSMRTGDQALIAVSSGQLGFLQQFTDNREVLLKAASRIKFNSASIPDQERPKITPYEAFAIDVGMRDIIEYKKIEFVRAGLKAPRAMLENLLRQRAAGVLRHTKLLNLGMFSTLETVVRGSSAIPGRKLLLFASEGFFVDQRDRDVQSAIGRVVDAASRSGVVLYTLDLRGLQVAGPDASADVVPSLVYKTDSITPASGVDVSLSETSDSLRPLRALAYDTGGRPIINTNALEKSVEQVVGEYQNYYVLAWQPEKFEPGKAIFHRLEVKVKGQPQARVFTRRGFFNEPPPETISEAKEEHARTGAEAPPENALREAVRAPYERRDLSLSVYPIFKNEADPDSMIGVNVEVSGLADARAVANSPDSELEIVYVALDLNGKLVASEGRKLIYAQSASGGASLVTQFATPLAPGTYQIRIGARDSGGRIGTKFEWIEAPDFAPGKMALSSLLISERKAGMSAGQETSLNIERRFARSSRLLLQVYVYNAARRSNAMPPEVTMEIDVLRRGKSALNAPPHPLALDNATDLSRIPYSAEVPLRGFAPGLYSLRVKAADWIGKTEAIRSVNFIVE